MKIGVGMKLTFDELYEVEHGLWGRIKFLEEAFENASDLESKGFWAEKLSNAKSAYDKFIDGRIEYKDEEIESETK